MSPPDVIDDIDIAAARAVIDSEGWPSRDRAPEWLARVMRASANAMGREVDAAVLAEREACAVEAESLPDHLRMSAHTPGIIADRIRARGAP